MIKRYKNILFIGLSLVLINLINQTFYVRYDLTQDQRYTITKVTSSIVNSIEKELVIRVYLEGDFPSEFKRLQIETKQFLEELAIKNRNIKIKFLNPEEEKERLMKSGMMPSQLTVEENGKLSSVLIFPWAELNYQNKSELVSLLPLGVVQSQDQQMQAAIENLEFSFANAIHNLLKEKTTKIAVLSGNGELDDIYLYSFLSEVKKKHFLAKFTLDSVEKNPLKSLRDLSSFDLAIIAKPTEKFTEKEKLVLDQFIMQGAKTLWMIENIQADTDSLYNDGKMLAYPRDLNVTDLLFSYGLRINNFLVKDLYAAKIPLATGNIGNQPQFQNLPWFYHPLVSGNPFHAITKNVAPVRMRFANPIDTLENSIKKTPLLLSSPLTKLIGTPNFIELQSVADKPKEQEYQSGNQLFAVLLEGEFNSSYKGRIKPFTNKNHLNTSKKNKMIVISDGDVGKNQVLKGKPFDLATDKWTNEQFGNKEFLLNSVDYLLDDSGLIELRNKTLQINLLNKQRAYEERTYWQFLNIIAPLLLLFSFGFIFNFLRKRKYR